MGDPMTLIVTLGLLVVAFAVAVPVVLMLARLVWFVLVVLLVILPAAIFGRTGR